MAAMKTVFLPGATLQFQEVTSMSGLPTGGYQIFRIAPSLDYFVKSIPWKHYYAYGLELRYVLRVETAPETFAFTAHLFHKHEPTHNDKNKNKTLRKRTRFKQS